ncbi:MAG: hypothetical protein ABI411_07140 [Tahibacter sp.]
MRKVLLIGCGGAGKSTLARRIAARTGLPLIHLDQCFWRPGWIETPRDVWSQTVAELIRNDAWVMDGNYGGSLDVRLAACDIVIFLDVSPFRCFWRLVRRRVRFHGKSRPDISPGCSERLDLKFLAWILAYRRTSRPAVMEKLNVAAERGKRVWILNSPSAVEDFMRRCDWSIFGSFDTLRE